MLETFKTFDFNPLPIEVEVKDLSFVKQFPRLMGSPHKANFHQIIWLQQGRGVFRVDFRDVVVQDSELFVIAAGQVCQFDTESDYSGKLILFTESFFIMGETDSNFLYTSEMFNPVSLNKIVSVDPIQMSNLIKMLEDELRRASDSFHMSMIYSYLKVILFETERCMSLSYPVTNDSLGRRFYNAVEQHFKTNRRIEFYIDLLLVSEKALSKEIKTLSGKTPKAYIDFRTILEAKRLLSYSSLSAKEIAFELGFDEPTNFHKYFRKYTGYTPLKFRHLRNH